ncbi:hypothetical protein KSS87_015791, partial [Heliosperma pusillum]
LQSYRNVDLVCRVSENDDTQTNDNDDQKNDEHANMESTSSINSNTPKKSELPEEVEQVSTEVLNSDSNATGNNEMKIQHCGGGFGPYGGWPWGPWGYPPCSYPTAPWSRPPASLRPFCAPRLQAYSAEVSPSQTDIEAAVHTLGFNPQDARCPMVHGHWSDIAHDIG